MSLRPVLAEDVADLATRLAPHLPDPQPPVTVEDHGTYLTITIPDVEGGE